MIFEYDRFQRFLRFQFSTSKAAESVILFAVILVPIFSAYMFAQL